ncbi:hypothetical protein [Streptomyces massasporeus]|uniref:hypothetical protein n=1 Tax=Streptomyces massasporeus TaxID=67324 RepID=UPI0033D77858
MTGKGEAWGKVGTIISAVSLVVGAGKEFYDRMHAKKEDQERRRRESEAIERLFRENFLQDGKLTQSLGQPREIAQLQFTVGQHDTDEDAYRVTVVDSARVGDDLKHTRAFLYSCASDTFVQQ